MPEITLVLTTEPKDDGNFRCEIVVKREHTGEPDHDRQHEALVFLIGDMLGIPEDLLSVSIEPDQEEPPLIRDLDSVPDQVPQPTDISQTD